MTAPLQAEPVFLDTRDETIAMLQAQLSLMQSTAADKMQPFTASESMKHQQPAPTMYSHANLCRDAVVSQESDLRPANLRIVDQSRSRFPIASTSNESDEFCNFMFRMQQHSNQSHELSMQRTVERLELEKYFQSRQITSFNNAQTQWRYS